MQHDLLAGGIDKCTVLIGQRTVMSLVAMLMVDLTVCILLHCVKRRQVEGRLEVCGVLLLRPENTNGYTMLGRKGQRTSLVALLMVGLIGSLSC